MVAITSIGDIMMSIFGRLVYAPDMLLQVLVSGEWFPGAPVAFGDRAPHQFLGRGALLVDFPLVP